MVGADASFAEAAIFSPATFPVNAVAMAGTRLVGIAASSVLRALRDNSAIGLRMLTSLGRWEARQIGPPCTRIGRKVLYRRTSVESWINAQEQTRPVRTRRGRK